MSDGSHDERLAALVRATLDGLPLGVAATSAPLGVEQAVEAVFRWDVGQQWPGWPPEWTTDGMVSDLMWRRDDRELAVAGRLWIDFTGRVIAVLATFALVGGRVVARAHVADVDPTTGRTPTFGSECLLLDGAAEGESPEPHRTDRRRLVPVRWTQVAVVGAEGQG